MHAALVPVTCYPPPHNPPPTTHMHHNPRYLRHEASERQAASTQQLTRQLTAGRMRTAHAASPWVAAHAPTPGERGRVRPSKALRWQTALPPFELARRASFPSLGKLGMASFYIASLFLAGHGGSTTAPPSSTNSTGHELCPCIDPRERPPARARRPQGWMQHDSRRRRRVLPGELRFLKLRGPRPPAHA